MSASVSNGYSYARRILESNEFQMLFCFSCGVTSLLPIILKFPSNLEKKPLRSALSMSPEFTYCCVATMALVIPLFFDLLLDLLTMAIDASRSVHKKKLKPAAKEMSPFNFLNINERFLLLLGFIMLPLVAFLPKNTDNLALIYICCNKCQLNWVGGTVAISLCRYDKEYWTVRSTILSLVSFGIGLAGSPYIDNVYAAEDPVSLSTSLIDTMTSILSILPCLVFFFNSSRWFVVVYLKAISWKSILMCSSNVPQPTAIESHSRIIGSESDHTFFPMVYTCISTITWMLIFAICGTSSRIDQFNGINLVQSTVPFLVFIVLITTLSMRLVKYEVVQGLVSFLCHVTASFSSLLYLTPLLLSLSVYCSTSNDDEDSSLFHLTLVYAILFHL